MTDLDQLLRRKPRDSRPDLIRLFHELNKLWFGGVLAAPKLFWNSRLRASAGRFVPGSRPRQWFSGKADPPVIEIASYLVEEERAAELVRDTLGHEMIHYWLWARGRPYGHTAEFLAKMREMGVSRYNPVPRKRPYKYLYECANCAKKYPARRKLGTLACGACCKQYSGGRFDPRFRLVFAGAHVHENS